METQPPYNTIGNRNPQTVTPGNSFSQPTYVVVAPPQQSCAENYNGKVALLSGIIQLLCGLLAIGLSIGKFFIPTMLAPVSDGIWCGVFFILAGSFTITSSRIKNKCWMVTSLVFSIFGAIATIPIVVLSSIDISVGEEWFYEDKDDNDEPQNYAVNGALLFVAVVEFIFAVVAMSLACTPLCCSPTQITPRTAPHPQYAQNSVQPGQQFILLAPVNGYQPMPQNQQVMGVQGMVTPVQSGYPAPMMTASGGAPPPAYVAATAAPTYPPQTPTEPAKPPNV